MSKEEMWNYREKDVGSEVKFTDIKYLHNNYKLIDMIIQLLGSVI